MLGDSDRKDWILSIFFKLVSYLNFIHFINFYLWESSTFAFGLSFFLIRKCIIKGANMEALKHGPYYLFVIKIESVLHCLLFYNFLTSGNSSLFVTFFHLLCLEAII